MTKNGKTLLVLFIIAFGFSGCLYKMPEDDCSTNPTTNNPAFTQEKAQSWMMPKG